MLFDPTDKGNARPEGPSADPQGVPWDDPIVRLVPFDPRLPARLAPADPESQCDCACFAVEGEDLPALSAPVSFYLELTSFCNNHCPGCGNVFVQGDSRQVVHTPSAPLTANQWAQVLDKVQPYACRLKLTGGEPTLHPEFETILAHVASLNVPFTLFTNGRWTARRRLIDLLSDTPNFEGLLVSLHGPEPTSHQVFTRAAGSFAETLTSIWVATTAGLPVSVSCVITHHNWHSVDEMLEMSRQLGVNSVVFNRYLGPAIAGLSASPEELRAAIHRVRALRASGEPVKFGNCVPVCFAPTGQAGCLAGRAFMTVDPWGQVRPCNHSTLFCGNLLQQSVAEVWSSTNMDRWRNWQPAPCKDCAAFHFCGGGCHAQASSLGLEADPLVGELLPATADQPRTEWILYEQARPAGLFARRQEEFGSLLISGNRLFPVSHEMQGLLNMLDGGTTLRQIETAHGAFGLALVVSLYQNGMLEFQV